MGREAGGVECRPGLQRGAAGARGPDRSRDAFASAELDLLSAIAAQLGITVQNSQLYERMKERDRLAALGQMAAGLAHEIRNPLGAIKGAAEYDGLDRQVVAFLASEAKAKNPAAIKLLDAICNKYAQMRYEES